MIWPDRFIRRSVLKNCRMFGEQIEADNADNPELDCGKLFKVATHMWLGCGEDAYAGACVTTIQCPLLVVHGGDDMLVSWQQALELTERVKVAGILNLSFAKHTLLKDMPEYVFSFLRDFMNRITI